MENNNNKTTEYINRLNHEKELREKMLEQMRIDQEKKKQEAKKKKEISVVPIFIVAGVFFGWSLLPFFIGFFPLMLLVGGAIYGFSNLLFPPKVPKEKKRVAQEERVVKEAPEPPKRKSTGDPDIDKMIEDTEKAMIEMNRLNDEIQDPVISEQIEHLQLVTGKIVVAVIKDHKKKTQVRRFFNYYLPTTIKLLNSYDRMGDAGVSGMNIDGIKGKVEEMMKVLVTAYDKQLDALFADEALDISTDITVMENLLRSEGLTEEKGELKNG